MLDSIRRDGFNGVLAQHGAMVFDPVVMARRDCYRAPHIDYTRGVFLVTFCTAHRRRELASLERGELSHTALGGLMMAELLRTPEVVPGVDLDEHIVMPNHVHVIFHLHGVRTLGQVVGGLKSRVTREARRSGVVATDKTLWHRSFHDSCLHTPADLERARAYIRNNPRRHRD